MELRTLVRSFPLLEMAIFPAWQKAGPTERERITKKFGELQAKTIIEQIELEALQLYPRSTK